MEGVLMLFGWKKGLNDWKKNCESQHKTEIQSMSDISQKGGYFYEY